MLRVKYTKINSVGLPAGIRRRAAVRPSLLSRAGCTVDKFVTRVQERLEQDDTARQKLVAYTVITLTAVYLLGAVLIWRA